MKVSAIAITALTLCLTACGGSSSDTEANTGALPEVNLSLDSQTAAGIWLLQSDQTGNYTSDKLNTNLNTVRSVRQFVIINELANGRYEMPGCGLNLFHELKDIQLKLEDSRVIDAGISYQSGITDETYTVDLTFEDNLMFSGTIEVIEQFDASGDLYYKNQKTATITAVKVSDSTDFESADELSIEFSAQLNNQTELSLIDIHPPVSCFAISSASHNGNQIGQLSSLNEEAISILDIEDNEAQFAVRAGMLGSEVIDHKTYSSTLSSLLSRGTTSCADDDTDCSPTATLALSQSFILDSPGTKGISTSTAATNEKGDILNFHFLVEIK